MATPIIDLRNELKARMTNRGGTSATALTDARYDFALRGAIRRIANPRVHRHAELEDKQTYVTVAGVETIVLTTPVWAIFAVKCTTAGAKRRLIVRGHQQMLEIDKSQGQPMNYSRYNRTMYLDPIPNGVYSIDVWAYQYPVFSTASPMTGNCPLHEIYDESVLIMSEAIIHSRFLKDPSHAASLRGELREELTAISPDEGDRDDMEDTLGISFDYMRVL